MPCDICRKRKPTIIYDSEFNESERVCIGCKDALMILDGELRHLIKKGVAQTVEEAYDILQITMNIGDQIHNLIRLR